MALFIFGLLRGDRQIDTHYSRDGIDATAKSPNAAFATRRTTLSTESFTFHAATILRSAQPGRMDHVLRPHQAVEVLVA